jgi:hypothetical protein
MKHRVFLWMTQCNSVSYDNYYEFTDKLENIVEDNLSYFKDEMLEIDNFEINHRAEFRLYIPTEKYSDEEFDKIEEEVETAADEFLAGWSFEEELETDISV